MTPEERVRELGLAIPAASAPAGLYAPAVRSGALLYVSGQLPMLNGELMRTGYCGAGLSADECAALARQCSRNALGAVRGELGSLDRVVRALRVAGYVASAPGFIDHPLVINGASQVLIDVFAEAGRHARVAIGVAELPRGAPVEVEYLFEVA